MQQKSNNEIKQKITRFVLLMVILTILYYFFSSGSAEGGNSTIRQGVKGVFKGL